MIFFYNDEFGVAHEARVQTVDKNLYLFSVRWCLLAGNLNSELYKHEDIEWNLDSQKKDKWNCSFTVSQHNYPDNIYIRPYKTI
jgi:hypothetical protein